jgi:hypothetical protein
MSANLSAAPMLEAPILLEDEIRRRPGPSTGRIFDILGAYDESCALRSGAPLRRPHNFGVGNAPRTKGPRRAPLAARSTCFLTVGPGTTCRC